MSFRLPPLRALLAFESAARHGSFARAAGELRVTPSAISHQIHAIEQFLGIRLFKRAPGGLSLTEAGYAYRRRIEAALQSIADATEAIAPRREADLLSIHATASFAAKWLQPRLAGFLAENPDLRVRVNATPEAADFAAGRIDLAICYGDPRQDGLALRPLVVETVQPLCSPRLLAGRRRLRGPRDLVGLPLIHSINLLTWSDWFRSAGVDGVDVRAGLWFDRSHMAIDAAVEGLGVILESDLLTAAERKDGRLVAPLAGRSARHRVATYCLACLPEMARTDKVQRFVAWICRTLPAANRADTRPPQAGGIKRTRSAATDRGPRERRRRR